PKDGVHLAADAAGIAPATVGASRAAGSTTMVEFDAAAVRERYGEQLMSDEHLLGAAPEDAVRLVLDDALTRLDVAAQKATSEEEFAASFERIRKSARDLLERVSGQEDSAEFVRAALAEAQPAHLCDLAGDE